MIDIKSMINKIIFDPREDSGEYLLYYYDRVEGSLVSLHIGDIDHIETNFLVTKDGRDIPLHRIRKIEKQGEVVWER